MLPRVGEERIKITSVSADWLSLSLTFGIPASTTGADACGGLADTAFLVSSIPCIFTFILLNNTAHCLQFPLSHFKEFLESAVILSVTQSRMGSHCSVMLLNSIAPWKQVIN